MYSRKDQFPKIDFPACVLGIRKGGGGQNVSCDLGGGGGNVP